MRRIGELVNPRQRVMVVETGYPDGPLARGYSPEAQAELLAGAWTSSRDAGVAGFMPFAIADGSGPDPDYTALDQANLDRPVAVFRDGDVGALVGFFLEQNQWMTTRMASRTQAVEARWGVFGPEGEALPALEQVRAIASATAP